MAASSIASTSWLKALLQQFESGHHCDVVIRVRFAGSDDEAAKPPKQRPRTTQDGAAAAALAGGSYTDIPAHAMVITARSEYMASCLNKEWWEGQQRMVELTLEDEQALEDLRLLLRLSYTESYVKEGDTGELLPRPVLMRLAALADALEFTEAVEQVVASLAVDLDLEDALTILDDLPPVLEGHEGMAAVREAVVAKLAEGIGKLDVELDRLREEQAAAADEQGQGQAQVQPEHEVQERVAEIATLESKLTHAGGMLATRLGPVAAMFREHEETDSDEFSYYTMLPLRTVVKELPPSAMEALLKSERLQLQTESEAYMLLCSWLDQSPHVTDNNRLATYRRLVRHIRFRHFPLHYVGNVLPHCPLLRESGLLPSVLTSALVLRDAPLDLLRREHVSEDPRNRGIAEDSAVWMLTSSIPLASCESLESGEGAHKVMGIVAGYPFVCSVEKRKQEDGGETCGLFFKLLMPKIATDAQRPPAPASLNNLPRGSALQLKVVAGRVEGTLEGYFSRDSWGWDDHFMKPWAEVVREGSPHFPDGKLEVTVGASMAVEE